MKVVLFVTTLFLTTMIRAAVAAPESCQPLAETKGGTLLQRAWLEQAEICMLSVSPTDAYKDMVYRDYVLTGDGMFMVFNSYGTDGQFGARDFYMFPRRQIQLSYQWNENAQELVLEHVTGDRFVFDINKAVLKSISGASKVVVDKVSPKNGGGVSIVGYKGQILDVGFSLNQDPSMNRNGSSVLRDRQRSCSLRNRDLFRYVSDGDVIFRFKTDAEFQKLVSSTCQ